MSHSICPGEATCRSFLICCRVLRGYVLVVVIFTLFWAFPTCVHAGVHIADISEADGFVYRQWKSSNAFNVQRYAQSTTRTTTPWSRWVDDRLESMIAEDDTYLSFDDYSRTDYLLEVTLDSIQTFPATNLRERSSLRTYGYITVRNAWNQVLDSLLWEGAYIPEVQNAASEEEHFLSFQFARLLVDEINQIYGGLEPVPSPPSTLTIGSADPKERRENRLSECTSIALGEEVTGTLVWLDDQGHFATDSRMFTSDSLLVRTLFEDSLQAILVREFVINHLAIGQMTDQQLPEGAMPADLSSSWHPQMMDEVVCYGTVHASLGAGLVRSQVAAMDAEDGWFMVRHQNPIGFTGSGVFDADAHLIALSIANDLYYSNTVEIYNYRWETVLQDLMITQLHTK